MDYIFDLALLVISGCSAIYCWTLSRRLRTLQNLRKGMGKAMVNLTKSVTSVESNAAKLNRDATAAVTELQQMLGRVDAAEGKVDELLETMDRQARETWKEYRARTTDTSSAAETSTEALKELIADAKVMASLMNEQLITLAEARDKFERELSLANKNMAKAQAKSLNALNDAQTVAVSEVSQMIEEVKNVRAEVKQDAKSTQEAHEKVVETAAVVRAKTAKPKVNAAAVAAMVEDQQISDQATAYNAAKAAKLAALRKAARAKANTPILPLRPLVENVKTDSEVFDSLASLAESTDKGNGAAPKVAAVARKLAEEKVASAARVAAAKRKTALAANPFTASATRRVGS